MANKFITSGRHNDILSFSTWGLISRDHRQHVATHINSQYSESLWTTTRGVSSRVEQTSWIQEGVRKSLEIHEIRCWYFGLNIDFIDISDVLSIKQTFLHTCNTSVLFYVFVQLLYALVYIAFNRICAINYKIKSIYIYTAQDIVYTVWVCWYARSTLSNHKQKAFKLLSAQHVEHFSAPLKHTHCWLLAVAWH